MEKKNDFPKALLALALIFAVFAGVLIGANALAAPLIAKNGSAAELAPLYAVLPEAKGFELLYDANDPAASALSNVADTVQSVYAETSGLGYALRLSTTEGYTGEPMDISLGIDSEGKIAGAAVTAYPDTKDMGVESYPLSYLGQDSALGGVGLVAGVTYSSSAFKNAVTDGFSALIDNGLIGAGVKSDAQLLTELIPLVFPGMANSAGVLQLAEEPTPLGGMLSANGGGAAYILEENGASYLVIVNLDGAYRVYDTAGAEVTGAADVSAILADAAASLEPVADSDIRKLGKMLDGAEIEKLPLDGVFSSVTGAYRLSDGENQYLAFSARTYGYSNLPIVTYYILDPSGAIVAMDADELILIKEYFSSYTLDEPSYKAGFAGLTGATWDGQQALISGATLSTEAVRTATDDIFAAFTVFSENGTVEQLTAAAPALEEAAETENGGESDEG